MTGKHSPGPWKWEAGIGLLFDAEGCIVNDLGMSCDAADARLIAAAPELLDALIAIMPHIPIGYAATGRPAGPAANGRNAALMDARAAAVAAIAKAEGRSDA